MRTAAKGGTARAVRIGIGSGAAALAIAGLTAAQSSTGLIVGEQRVAEGFGGFMGSLDPDDRFGASVVYLGDHDGDGVGDIAVGAPGDDDGDTDRGAVWILFLNSDGTVKSEQKISDTLGGFNGPLGLQDEFGSSLSFLGDLDGDGVGDIAVGAIGDDDGGFQSGAVWILALNTDGTVKAHQKISATQGGFGGSLDFLDRFGSGVSYLGDLDGDGVGDLAVGAPGDDNGGPDIGAAWILFMKIDGTVKSFQKISATQGGFTGFLGDGDAFGTSISVLSDQNGDGVDDLVVGAPGDDDGGESSGAIWLIGMNVDGTVKSQEKISATHGFDGELEPGDQFGASVAYLGDINGNAMGDVLVGAPGDDDGGADRGAFWLLFMEAIGSTEEQLKVSSTRGGFIGPILDSYAFATSMARLADIDGDGMRDVSVGVVGDSGSGAIWNLALTGAAVFVNPGSGINELAYFPGEFQPRVGTAWQPFIDFGEGVSDPLFHFVGVSSRRADPFALLGTPTMYIDAIGGELLISLDPEDLIIFETTPTDDPEFVIVIPDDVELVGTTVYSQAGAGFPAGIKLANGLDIVVGL